MKSKDKLNITERVLLCLLVLVFVSLTFKAFGSTLFNKVLTNQRFIKIGNFIDSSFILNNIVYGIMNFILTYCFVSIVSKELYVKIWYYNVIIIAFSLILTILRYFFIGAITYLFDLFQYIVFPVFMGRLFFKKNIVSSIVISFVMYFSFVGIMNVIMVLNNLFLLQYGSDFISYILCFAEPYMYIVLISIYFANNKKENLLCQE